MADSVTNGSVTNGWHGKISLDFGYHHNSSVSTPDKRSSELFRSGSTRLMTSQSIAPLKVQRPFYPEGDRVCHSVIVHTAGGMVGGDRLNQNISVSSAAHALVTTAAASKAYKSNGQSVHQAIHMTVATNGCLEWLPQPLIMFNGAQYDQHLRVDLAPEAIWIGWDITRLGRTLRGERFDAGRWRSRLEIWQEDIPLWIDLQWIQGGSDMLTSTHGLNRCPVVGTFAMLGKEVSDTIVHQARVAYSQPQLTQETSQGRRSKKELLSGSTGGVSQLQSGLVCRYRGHSTIEAQRWFMHVWQLVRQEYLARSICPPRVWQWRL
ncbi:MAG: urease accessory protein UreD [Cyanobacteria bacterium P01_F01_bin.150]